MFAVDTPPTLQPARVKGTQGAGVTVLGVGVGLVVAGGVAEYAKLGLVSCPAFGVRAVSKIGSVQ
jgi:hypothetical protein